jgi:UrcA family protein
MRAPRDGCARDDDSCACIAKKASAVGASDGDHTMKRSILGFAALALVGSFQAQAGEINSERRVIVRYDDINVREAAGARILLARIDQAADDVCGPAPDMRQLGMWESFRDCRKTAMDNAMASLPFNLMAAIEHPDRPEALASR